MIGLVLCLNKPGVMPVGWWPASARCLTNCLYAKRLACDRLYISFIIFASIILFLTLSVKLYCLKMLGGKSFIGTKMYSGLSMFSLGRNLVYWCQ